MGLTSALALTRRNLTAFFHSRFALVGVLMVPLVLLLGFGVIYTRVFRAVGIHYVDFLVPGVALQATMFACVGSAWTLAADRQSGFQRVVLIFVQHPRSIIGGRILTDVTKTACAVAVVLVSGVVMGFRIHTGLLAAAGAVAIVVLFSVVCSLIFVVIGGRARRFRLVQPMTLAIFPLFFLLSTTISPASAFPTWLQPLVRNTPVSVVGDTVRSLLSDQPTSLLAVTIWFVALGVVFGALAHGGLRRFRSVS